MAADPGAGAHAVQWPRRAIGVAAGSAASALVGRGKELAFLVGAILVGAYVGRALAFGRPEIALLIAGAILGIALLSRLSLGGWCVLLLVTTVATRGPVGLAGLPQIFNFLHYPIAVGFAIVASSRSHRESRAPGRWLLVFLGLVIVSAIANGTHIMRAMLFLMITGEPLLILWAITRWGIDEGSDRKIGRIVILLAALQLPIALYQGLTLGWSDFVQGTLTGHGAGHHVLGGLFSLILFVVVAAVRVKRLPLVAGIPLGAVALGMMLATGSMAVTVISSVALVISSAIPLKGGSRGSKRGFRPAAVLISLAMGVTAMFAAQIVVPRIYERAAVLLDLSRLPEVQIVSERAAEDPLALIIGSGPGTSASRASLLVAAPKEESPVAGLGLEPTEMGVEIYNSTRNSFGGSAEDFASSALAFLGDLGLVGGIALIALFVGLWRGVQRSQNWRAPAAATSIVAIAALVFVDNWIEYPEYAVPLAILLGMVLADRKPVRRAVGESALS